MQCPAGEGKGANQGQILKIRLQVHTDVQLKIEFELKLKIEIFWLLVEKGLALMTAASSNDKGQFVKNISS